MDILTMLILHQLPLQLYVWNAIKRTEMPEPFNFRLKQLCLWDQTDYKSGLTLSSRPLLNPKPDLLTSDVRTEANVCPLGENNKWQPLHLVISSAKQKRKTTVNYRINRTVAHSIGHMMRNNVLPFWNKTVHCTVKTYINFQNSKVHKHSKHPQISDHRHFSYV